MNVHKLTYYNIIQGSHTTEPTSELSVKQVSRPARILQSPFIPVERRLFKHDDNVVFENYEDHVEEVDRSAFMNWFQRGYKTKNKYVHFVYILSTLLKNSL